MFLVFCPQWEVWLWGGSPPAYLLSHMLPFLSFPDTTTQIQPFQGQLSLVGLTFSRDGRRQQLASYHTQLVGWSKAKIQSQNLNPDLHLEPCSLPHITLGSWRIKRCHLGGTQNCILIEKSVQSQHHSARLTQANRKAWSTMIAFMMVTLRSSPLEDLILECQSWKCLWRSAVS